MVGAPRYLGQLLLPKIVKVHRSKTAAEQLFPYLRIDGQEGMEKPVGQKVHTKYRPGAILLPPQSSKVHHNLSLGPCQEKGFNHGHQVIH